MKENLNLKGYYFITDRNLSRRGNTADVRAACAAGVGIIQYREKCASSADMYAEALLLKRMCTGTLFIVNDRLDIALAVDADGVHVGQDDLPPAVVRRFLGREKLIGVSVGTLEEAQTAAADGADYLGVGPVFATSTKPDAGQACGLQVIAEIKKAVDLPIVAIGGITLSNAPAVVSAGADMVSAISAVVADNDAKTAIRRFKDLFV